MFEFRIADGGLRIDVLPFRPLFFFVIIHAIIAVSVLPSQTNRLSTISGRVTDASTREPLPFVNVFLSNTTLGSATDLNGNYFIQNVPPGIYDLVIARIGYEIKTFSIAVLPGKNVTNNARLAAKTIEGEEIQIEAEEPTEWRKKLERFIPIFLGQTSNAARTRVLNPEVLELKVDSISNQLTASSDSVVVVENMALGYRLHLLLQKFQGDEFYCAYVFYPRFEPLNAGAEKEREWQRNRLRAYKGSFRHFLSSLAKGTASEEKFFVYSSASPKLDDPTSRFIKTSKLDLRPSQTTPGAYRFKFDGYLKVVYGGAVKHEGAHFIKELKDFYPVSFIKLNVEYVLIDSFGNNLTPLGITKYGFWEKQRVADLVPLDYIPPE